MPPVPEAKLVGMRTLNPIANAFTLLTCVVGAAGVGVHDGGEVPVTDGGPQTIWPTVYLVLEDQERCVWHGIQSTPEAVRDHPPSELQNGYDNTVLPNQMMCAT